MTEIVHDSNDKFFVAHDFPDAYTIFGAFSKEKHLNWRKLTPNDLNLVKLAFLMPNSILFIRTKIQSVHDFVAYTNPSLRKR